MNAQDRDEKLWRFLGGQPPSREFSEMISSNPAMARRLAELAMIECSIRDESVKSAGRGMMRRRRSLLFGGVGAFLTIVIAAFLGWGVVKKVPEKGIPMAVESGGESSLLVSELRSGNTVRVREKAFSLSFSGEETELTFEPKAEVRFEETTEGGKRVLLTAGRLNANVDHQRESFQVKTPHFSVDVLGTAFDVTVSKEASEVLVAEGVVAVAPKSKRSPIRLEAGNGWKQDEDGRGFSVASAAHVAEGPQVDQRNDSIWVTESLHANHFHENEDTPSASDHSSQWRAVWNEDALYVLIEVSDSEADGSNAKVWANDSVEIFIDADNSRGASFDGVNDHFLFFEPDREAITPGVGALNPGPGITHLTHRTAEGFRAEIRLPWAALGIEPKGGLRLGFNVASNDSDPGDGKRSQLSWTPKSGNDWSRPDRMGFLILSSPVSD